MSSLPFPEVQTEENQVDQGYTSAILRRNLCQRSIKIGLGSGNFQHFEASLIEQIQDTQVQDPR